MLDMTQRYQDATAMKQDIDEILQHDFQTSSEGSIYLRGSSGTLAASRSGTVSPSPVRPETPRRLDPISPLPYSEGLRPLPGSEFAPPRRPIHMESWRDGPFTGSYQEQKMMPRRQRQMFFVSPMVNQPQSENSRFIAMSFFFLLIVVALIAGLLIVLPWLQSLNF